jgi:hypothetical protein
MSKSYTRAELEAFIAFRELLKREPAADHPLVMKWVDLGWLRQVGDRPTSWTVTSLGEQQSAP